jgi:hypothetical protein
MKGVRGGVPLIPEHCRVDPSLFAPLLFLCVGELINLFALFGVAVGLFLEVVIVHPDPVLLLLVGGKVLEDLWRPGVWIRRVKSFE